MKLLYDATDWRLAQQAVDELRSAGISCHFAGEPTVEQRSEDTLTTSAEPDPQDFDETPAEAERRVAREQSGAPSFRRYIPTYPIFVDRDEDFERASDILIKLGAAKEPMLKESTIQAINRWSIGLVVLIVIVIVLALLQGRH